MTTAPIPVDQFAEQARTTTARPGRALATVIAWVFVALGWLAGGAWRGVVFCAVSARYGYWRGLGLTENDIIAKAAPPPPPPAR